MCQRLYVASAKPLRTVSRGRSSPYLSVEDAEPSANIRRQLRGDLPHVYLAGGHVECGCGFLAISDETDASPRRVDPADVASMSALADHLRDACRKHEAVQLYLCWPHEEAEEPIGRRSASLSELKGPEFRFRHRELLTVGR
jgi:hypothetical protein